MKNKKGHHQAGKKKKNKTNPFHATYHPNPEEEIASLYGRIEAETPAIGSTPPTGVVTFASLPISVATLSGLTKTNYTTMTKIQSASIPHALAGRDILGAAKTGSGKTLSFVIPILECLYRHRWNGKADGPGAIVLSPTRELAGQIFAVLRKVGVYHKTISVGLLVGGKKDLPLEQQHIPYTNIIIATPGRLLQHLEQTPLFNVDQIKMLILGKKNDKKDNLICSSLFSPVYLNKFFPAFNLRTIWWCIFTLLLLTILWATCCVDEVSHSSFVLD